MAWGRWCASIVFACACNDLGNYHEQQACTNDAPAGTHALGAISENGNCVLDCIPGFRDCNGVFADGCEVEGACPKPPPPPPLAEQLRLLVELVGAPNGVVVCNAHVYYLDGSNLMAVDPNVQGVTSAIASSPSSPTGGLACDGTFLYWPAVGGIIRVALVDATLDTIVSGVDPGRGIDTRASKIYWIARTGFGDAGAMLVASDDGGTAAELPITEGSAYKSFALGAASDFAIHGTNVAELSDAGVTTYAFGAPLEVLFAGGSSLTVYALSAGALMGANDPSNTLVNGLQSIVAAAASGDTVVLASDATVYTLHLSTKYPKLVSGEFLHVTDVATDGAHAFFLTRGEGSETAALWKAPVPP